MTKKEILQKKKKAKEILNQKRKEAKKKTKLARIKKLAKKALQKIGAGDLRIIAVQSIHTKLYKFVRYSKTKPPTTDYAEGEICLIDGRKFRLTVEEI